MTYKDFDPPNWRNDNGLKSVVEYKKRFAYLKTECADGSIVWLKPYYKKYKIWSSGYDDGNYSHTDFIENITEAEYLVRMLSDNL